MNDEPFRRVARTGLAPYVEDLPPGPEWADLTTDGVVQSKGPKRPGWLAGVAAAVTVLVVIGVASFLSGSEDPPPPGGGSTPTGEWTAIDYPNGLLAINAVVIWADDRIILWGGQSPDVEESPTGEPGWSYELNTGEWSQLPASPKDAAVGAGGVWTGDEVIICCGAGDQFDDFAVTVGYDPVDNEWRRLADAPISGTFSETVWTGDEMLAVSLGGVAGYDPSTDTWTRYSDPPESNRLNEVVWTGEELIVWSREVERVVHPGYALNPSTGEWRRLPDPPAWPAAPDLVWTGDRLVIWGGLPAHFVGSERAVGSVYDPVTDTWQAMSEVLPEPDGCECNLGSQALVWAGDRVLVAPGAFGSGVDSTGSLLLTYDPHADSWELVDRSSTPAPFAVGDLVTAGDRMIVRSPGALYLSPQEWVPEGELVTAEALSSSTTTTSPATTTTKQREAPPGWEVTEITFTIREGSSYASGGGWFFAWGGAVDRSGILRRDGVLINVDSGEVRRVPEAPISPRHSSSAVWTGSEFIVFGGHDFDESFLDGASLNPDTLEWEMIAEAPLSPAARPAAIWDGNEMVVWLAGSDSAFAEAPPESVGQLASYDPGSDKWIALPAPPVEVVDADLIIIDGGLLLVGGPGMRDGAGFLTRSLYASRLNRSTGEWTEPLLGPGVDSARLFELPDGRPAVLVDGGRIFALTGDEWLEMITNPQLSEGAGKGCWYDVGGASAGGQAYLKLCGANFWFVDSTQLVTIMESDDYGSTTNLLASAFLVDEIGRLIVFGDPEPGAFPPTDSSLFGFYSP